jgi:hypothetical protein
MPIFDKFPYSLRSQGDKIVPPFNAPKNKNNPAQSKNLKKHNNTTNWPSICL